MASDSSRPKRKFVYTSAEFYSHANLFELNLMEDLAILNSIDLGIDAAFLAEYRSNLQLIEPGKGPSPARTELSVLSAEVNGIMKEAREIVQVLSLYVKLLFPKNIGMYQVFGLNDYMPAHKNPVLMVTLLEQALIKVNEHAVGLASVGFSAVRATELADISAKLKLKLAEKESQKGIIKTIRDKFTVDQNKVYDQMVRIRNAAQIAFRHNPARLLAYRLKPERRYFKRKKKEVLEEVRD